MSLLRFNEPEVDNGEKIRKVKTLQRMVSTRGVKFKFSEGEKVLCYEPDPTKAKVLYDSKVLEVKSNKDQRGRKAVEYLIHFQGWNSSWDRCVCEDYVLKDTEENRQLQRDLAERAQLQLGAYLYRRDRKKRDRKLSEKVGDSLEGKRREGDGVGGDGSDDSSGDDSSCSRSQRDGDENHGDEGEDEEEEEEEVLASLNFGDFEDGHEMEDDDDDKVPLQLSDTLKRLLEQDHDLINKKNKVVRLPAEPNVVTILEGYLKHCAVNQLCGCSSGKPQCRMRSQQNVKARDVEKIRRSLVVCMEVLHGVRTYFDETLGTLLLYNNERQQYHSVRNDPAVKQEQTEDYGNGDLGVHMVKRERDDDTDMDADVYANNYDSTNGEPPDSGRKRLRSYRAETAFPQTNGFSKDEDSEDNFPLAHIKQEHNSVASTSSRCSSPVAAPGRSNRLLNCVLAWHLVPDAVYTDKPVYASLVYGATHLARLFVKLPDLLSTSNMSEKRLKVVLHYLDNFLSYLEDHSEWFGESFYKDNFSM